LRALIVGSSGFIGQALKRHLLAQGSALEGWSRSAERVDEVSYDRYEHHSIDALDPATLEGRRGSWDVAFQLAGYSVPGDGFTAREVVDNLRMTAHVLDHLARIQPGLRVIVMSSAQVYAPGPGRRREDEPLAPRSAYGLSKELCEVWAQARARDLDVVVVRAFNQIGPGMPSGLVVPDLLAALQRGSGPVPMRGADSTRDFLDVRDGVDALARLSQVDAPSGSVFNLCRGEGRRISELAAGLMACLGLQRELRFAADPPPPLVGDPHKLARAIGWSPRYALEDSLREIVAHSARGARPRRTS
jgi:nucleoside-diphosphate-sugar epimerase